MQKNLCFEEAVELLKQGEPIAFPTETVYGLGAPLYDERAIRKVFAIKGRPLDNPLIVHIATLEQALSVAKQLPPSFFLLAKRFWPGPLTLVVEKAPHVPSLVSAGHPTIALRMPSHPVARALIEAVGVPLVAPSANLSGKPSPTRLSDVWEDLEGRLEGGLDGGECAVGIESTVLSLISDPPLLLRPGHITQEMLEEVLGQKIGLAKKEDPVLSPGMKYRHYAPKAPLRLVYREEELQGPFILSARPLSDKKSHLLTAKTLYAELREADRLQVPQIEIYCDETIQSQAGLMNRLLRAAGLLL